MRILKIITFKEEQALNNGVGTHSKISFSYNEYWYITGIVQEVIHRKMPC